MVALSAKTRYGFGSDETPPPDAAAAPQRNARTVFGHQNHLPNLAIPAERPVIPADARMTAPGSAASAAPELRAPESPPVTTPARTPSSAPRKRTPVPTDRDESFERARTRRKSEIPSNKNLPKRTGPIPAVARFLGRRNTVGDIVPLREQTEVVELPARDQWVRPVVTIVAAAACSFIVVAIVMWLAGSRKSAEPAAAPKPHPAAMSKPAPTEIKTAQASIPRPMLETPPIELPANIAPLPRQGQTTKPISASRPFLKQPAQKPAKRSLNAPVHDPDAPMQPSLL